MDYEKSSFDTFELQLTPVAQGFLRETAKWAKFISIVGYIGIAIYVIMGLGMIIAGNAIPASAADSFGGSAAMAAKISPAVTGVIYIVAALLYFFPVMYLNKFAVKAQNALNSNHTDSLTESLENLKSHYKFMGILMIIALIFIALGLLLAIIGIGAMAAMS
jgi:hypothetical protein